MLSLEVLAAIADSFHTELKYQPHHYSRAHPHPHHHHHHHHHQHHHQWASEGVPTEQDHIDMDHNLNAFNNLSLNSQSPHYPDVMAELRQPLGYPPMEFQPFDPPVVRPPPSNLAREPPKYVLCRHYARTGICKVGDRCKFAHGELELDYWNSRVRSRSALVTTSLAPLRNPPDTTGLLQRPQTFVLCRHYIRGLCRVGDECRFAHGVEELDFWNAQSGLPQVTPDQVREQIKRNLAHHQSQVKKTPTVVVTPVPPATLPESDPYLRDWPHSVIVPISVHASEQNVASNDNNGGYAPEADPSLPEHLRFSRPSMPPKDSSRFI